MEENEVELMDLLKVIWKRKWLILIPALLCVIAAGVISFLQPRKWKIDALIMPSKFFVQSDEGQFEEATAVDPKHIVGQINQKSYTHLISAELNIDIGKFPNVKAENLRETNLIRISVIESNVEEAKRILHSLFTHVKKELDKVADLEMINMEAQIKSKEIEKLSLEKEIRVYKNKLVIVKQRKKEIEQEMIKTKRGIELLEKEQRLILNKEKKNQAESLAMLLYSNEIQQGLRYQNTLNELLSTKKIEEENINLEIEINEEKIKQIDNEIHNLNGKKEIIDFTKLIKEPTSSLSPIYPRKKLNVVIAGILALIIFTFLAFFLEYIEKQRAKD